MFYQVSLFYKDSKTVKGIPIIICSNRELDYQGQSQCIQYIQFINIWLPTYLLTRANPITHNIMITSTALFHFFAFQYLFWGLGFRAILFRTVASVITPFLVTAVGLIAAVYYVDCDPYEAGQITATDQV